MSRAASVVGRAWSGLIGLLAGMGAALVFTRVQVARLWLVRPITVVG